MLPDAEPVPCASFAGVFAAVERGAAERGVVPLHNSRAGMVEEVVKLLADDKPLAPRNYDHPLSGNWKDHRDCHIKPDLVLIYRKPDAEC